MNRIINRMLVEMDGFAGRVMMVAATNHADNLDPALRRAGRFDMVIPVDLPTVAERAQLFDLYAGRAAAEPRLDTAALVRMTSGMSPADIANTVKKAASRAAESGSAVVTQEHLLPAIESIQLGGDVNSGRRVLTESTRKRLACHEAAHAPVALRAGAGNVERVSIEPRGEAMGVTYVSRDSEDPLYAEGELAARMAMLLGGREAEMAIFGDVSSGASDDLRRATKLATSMVSTLGSSPNFGLLSMADVPKELTGPQTQEQVLQEARELLANAQRRARAKCWTPRGWPSTAWRLRCLRRRSSVASRCAGYSRAPRSRKLARQLLSDRSRARSSMVARVAPLLFAERKDPGSMAVRGRWCS